MYSGTFHQLLVLLYLIPTLPGASTRKSMLLKERFAVTLR